MVAERHPNTPRVSGTGLEILLEKAYDLTVVTAPDLTIQFASTSASGLLGWFPAALAGKKATDFIHPDDQALVLGRHAMHVADPTLSGTLQSELRLQHRDGHWVWFESRVINALHAPPPFNGIITHFHEISRRRRAEGRLERALAAVNALIYEWDPGTDEVDRYGGGARFLGLQEQDLGVQVQDWAARVHPEDRARVLATINAAREAGNRLELEYRVRRADGRYARVWERALTESGSGGDRRILGLAVDVTERWQIEQALRASEARFQAMLEAEPQCVKVLDHEGCLMHLNRAGLRMVEAVALDDVRGLPAAHLVCTEHLHEFESARTRALAGESVTLQFEMRGLQATRRWMETVMAPLPDASGRITQVIAVSVDITERRRREEWLKLQELVLDTQAEGVMLSDARTRIIYVNHALADMFGYAPQDLVGSSWLRLTRSTTAVAAAARGAPRQGGLARLEFDGIRSDGGQFRGVVVMNPVEVGGSLHWIGVVQDVSEQRALEMRLLESVNLQQERLGYELHDGLGQDLTAISLFLRGLQDRMAEAAPGLQQEVEEIRSLVNAAIQSTRDLARGMSPLAVDDRGLAAALRALVARSRDTYGLATRLRFELARDQEPDSFVAMQLYRIAQEALTNVARHARADNVTVILRADAGRLTLRVLDDGVGLPDDAAGTDGMGLKIMRFRANMIGGELLVRRRPGGGTAVQVRCMPGRPGLAERGPATRRSAG